MHNRFLLLCLTSYRLQGMVIIPNASVVQTFIHEGKKKIQ